MPNLLAPHIATLMAALDAGLVARPGAPVRHARRANDIDGGVVIEASPTDAPGLIAAGLEPTQAPTRWEIAPCWPALLPLEAAPEPRPPLGELLFITDTPGFAVLAGELLRLGCDRVSVCATDAGVACRVPDPPYFVVLRALGPDPAVRAYAQISAQVWVRLGWQHPRANLIDAPQGTHLLIDRETWRSLPDGPWTDVHQHLDVQFEATDTPAPRALDARLQVQLRLVPAPVLAPPIAWMLTTDAAAQLDALVTTLPEAVIQRLMFLVAGEGDEPRIILRARLGSGHPPSLDVRGRDYVRYHGVPNLLVPRGSSVDPPLRLGRLRSLLAPDPQQWVLLEPDAEGGGFTPIAVPEDAFSPLVDWVDYVIGRASAQLDPWLVDARFDFDAFVAMDVEWSDGPRTARTPKPPPLPPQVDAPETPTRRTRRDPVVAPTPRPAPPPPPAAPLTLSEAQVAVADAEAAFCALTLPHDDAARAPHWTRLAQLEHRTGREREAGLCWSHALWITPPDARAALAAQWVKTAPKRLKSPPTAEQLRGLVARILAGTPASEADQRVLTEHADLLDLRAWWLARKTLAERSQDRLALMQARDHVFDRLRGGLPLAANVPTFIRMHGVADGHGTEELAAALGTLVPRYLKTKRARNPMETAPHLTEGYVRLCVAWGHARLGQTDHARAERATALKRITPMDGVHGLCVALFDARLQQALSGRPPGAPLPPQIQTRREALSRIDRYKADRMRELSRILDPRRTFDPFELYQRADAHPFGDAFARVLGRPTPGAVAEGLDAIFKANPTDKRSLLGVIDVLGTLPENLSVPRLRAVVSQTKALPPDVAVEVLESGAVLAAALDRHDLVDEALKLLAAPAKALAAADPVELAASLARSAPVLRGAGHGSAVSVLLDGLDAALTDTTVTGRLARVQLAAARASLSSAASAQVMPAFDAVFGMLDQIPNQYDRYQHVRTLALALAQTTPTQAIAGVERLWILLPEVTDGFNTNSHFCLSVVQFMESMVLALASEALSLSPWARRWIETDEHALRRRIHQDIA